MSSIQPAKIAVRDCYWCVFIFIFGIFFTDVKVEAFSLYCGLGCGVKGDFTSQLNCLSGSFHSSKISSKLFSCPTETQTKYTLSAFFCPSYPSRPSISARGVKFWVQLAIVHFKITRKSGKVSSGNSF